MYYKTKSRNLNSVGSLAEQEADANTLILQIWKEKSSAQQEDPYVLPEHLEQFKKSYQSIVKKQFQLPVIPMLSPRTQKKISSVPKPNLMETLLLEKKTHEINKINPSTIYDKLMNVADSTRAAAHRKHITVEAVYAANQIASSNVALRDDHMSGERNLDTSSTEYFASVARRKLRHQAQQLSLQQSLITDAAAVPQRPPASPHRMIDLSSSSSYPFDSSLKRLVERDELPGARSALLSRSGTLPALEKKTSVSSLLDVQPEVSMVPDVDSIYSSIRSPHRSKSQPKLGVSGNGAFAGPRIVPKTPATLVLAKAVGISTSSSAKINASSVNESLDATTNPVNLAAIYQPVLAEVTANSNQILKSLQDTVRVAESTTFHELKSKQSYTRFLDQMKRDVLDELGVDVDEDFTRRRRFGEAVNMLVYYVSICKLKTSFARLREQVRHVALARRMMAAVTISKAFRQLQTLKHSADLRRNLALQQNRALLAEKRLQDQLNSKSARISGLLRYRLIRRLVKERFAARKIQSLVRGIRARVLAMELREWRQRRAFAAIVIQCSYRQYLARRRVSSIAVFN